MSTWMEDRLTAALRARADQVQPEDLRPVDVPVVPLHDRRRRRRTAALAALAVAACAGAVAGPLVLGSTDGSGSPDPAGPSEPLPTSSTERPGSGIAVDVDGDGRTDTARLAEEEARALLVVALGSGDRAVVPVRASAPDATPVTAGDLGGTPGEELVVPVSDDPSDLPAVYTWLDGEGLVEATYPESGLQGWQADLALNRWTVDKGRFRTWEDEPVPGDPRVPFWDWSVDDRARLRPGAMVLGCTAAGSVPVACEGPDRWGKDEPDLGPRGDLPTLMPAVEETLRDERFFYGRGPARGEYAQLQGDFGEEGGAVAEGDVELVVTLMDEGPHRIPISAGQSPRLVPAVLLAPGDAPIFAVQRSGGDTSVLELFTFWNGELIQVEPTGDVFLGSGIVDHQGELTEQRTWLTPDGSMFTAVLLDWETRRHQLWRWRDDLDAETIAPTDLGEACIDWETGNYGRC